MKHLHIITGGPGSGKTSLIAALAVEGLRCVPEAGRAIIQDQVRKGGRALSWDDQEAFGKREIPGTCSVECRGVKDVSTKEEVDTWRWHRWAPLGSRL